VACSRQSAARRVLPCSRVESRGSIQEATCGRRVTSGRATAGNPPSRPAHRPNESPKRKLASFLQRLGSEPPPPELPQRPSPDLGPEQSTQDATTRPVGPRWSSSRGHVRENVGPASSVPFAPGPRLQVAQPLLPHVAREIGHFIPVGFLGGHVPRSRTDIAARRDPR
jgi:hypothetical protein